MSRRKHIEVIVQGSLGSVTDLFLCKAADCLQDHHQWYSGAGECIVVPGSMIRGRDPQAGADVAPGL